MRSSIVAISLAAALSHAPTSSLEKPSVVFYESEFAGYPFIHSVRNGGNSYARLDLTPIRDGKPLGLGTACYIMPGSTAKISSCLHPHIREAKSRGFDYLLMEVSVGVNDEMAYTGFAQAMNSSSLVQICTESFVNDAAMLGSIGFKQASSIPAAIDIMLACASKLPK